MRVYIVGGPGSGKTRLGSALARELGAPHLDLDDLWLRIFERDADGKFTAAARAFQAQLVADYASRDAWVIEGAEPPFLDAFAGASDLIVWCDVPFVVAAWRMISRHVVADLRRRNRYPGYRRLLRFLRSVRRRYVAEPERTEETWTKWTRKRTVAAAMRYEAKLLRLADGEADRNVARVLRRIHATHA
jgi:adenylate kinase family enzyme